MALSKESSDGGSTPPASTNFERPYPLCDWTHELAEIANSCFLVGVCRFMLPSRPLMPTLVLHGSEPLLEMKESAVRFILPFLLVSVK